jgi:hypothetical protein
MAFWSPSTISHKVQGNLGQETIGRQVSFRSWVDALESVIPFYLLFNFQKALVCGFQCVLSCSKSHTEYKSRAVVMRLGSISC